MSRRLLSRIEVVVGAAVLFACGAGCGGGARQVHPDGGGSGTGGGAPGTGGGTGTGGSAAGTGGGTGTGGTAAGTGGGTGTGGTGGAGSPAPCPAGGWRLVKIACGANDVTAAWTMRVLSTTAVVVVRPNGGCQTTLTNQSPACSEIAIEETVPGADGWQISSQGITACTPPGCQFDTNDAACVVGDRAGTRAADAITMSGDTFTATTPGPFGICVPYNLPQITTWMRVD